MYLHFTSSPKRANCRNIRLVILTFSPLKGDEVSSDHVPYYVLNIELSNWCILNAMRSILWTPCGKSAIISFLAKFFHPRKRICLLLTPASLCFSDFLHFCIEYLGYMKWNLSMSDGTGPLHFALILCCCRLLVEYAFPGEVDAANWFVCFCHVFTRVFKYGGTLGTQQSKKLVNNINIISCDKLSHIILH